MQNNSVDILGSRISIFDQKEIVKILSENAKKNSSYVCIANVHTVVTGTLDADYLSITNLAFLATADGVPLIWASKILSDTPIHGRACGPDIMKQFMEDPNLAHHSHYFYGSTPEVLEKLIQKIKTKNPNAKILGAYSPPFRPAKKKNDPLNDEEISECKKVEELAPDFIWVGLGAPKQEIWMSRTYKFFSQSTLVGVGAAFDFLSGNKSRAPIWMQKIGMEWFFRLMSEPRRLFKRYLETNMVFIFKVIEQKIFRHNSTKKDTE